MKSNFGFIREKLDIKILILFLLRRLPEPVTFDELTGLSMCDDGISYFDFADCVADLVKTEHIALADGKYTLTEKGERNSAVTENNLPLTVRMEAERSAHELRTALDRSSLITTSRETKAGGGVTVSLSMSDGIGDVVSMELLTTNERQAIALEKGFRKGAERIYNELIELILREGAKES